MDLFLQLVSSVNTITVELRYERITQSPYWLKIVSQRLKTSTICVLIDNSQVSWNFTSDIFCDMLTTIAHEFMANIY